MEKQINRKSKSPKNMRYQENEEYRKRLKKLSRERYHIDSEYKKATLERAKKRYHQDDEYKAATIQRAKDRYQRLKIKKKLVKYFQRNGYILLPDEKLLGGNDNYKKGYEVRLVAKDKKELTKIKDLLNKAGFKIGKPFQKHNEYVQPIYGKEAVEKFQSFLSEQNKR